MKKIILLIFVIRITASKTESDKDIIALIPVEESNTLSNPKNISCFNKPQPKYQSQGLKYLMPEIFLFPFHIYSTNPSLVCNIC